MKIFKKVSLLFVAIILFSANSFAQPDNVIKVSLLSPFVKTGSFFYERALNDEMSLVGGFLFTSWSPADNVSLNGYGVTAEFRYYLSDKVAPSGAFIAPFGRFQKFNITESTDQSEATITSTGGGLLVGIQRMFKDRITLEAFIGPAYYKVNTEVISGTQPDSIGAVEGFSARGGVTVGVAF